jgi:hypothetical protein
MSVHFLNVSKCDRAQWKKSGNLLLLWNIDQICAQGGYKRGFNLLFYNWMNKKVYIA